jgi:hypothetical protein
MGAMAATIPSGAVLAQPCRSASLMIAPSTRGGFGEFISARARSGG